MARSLPLPGHAPHAAPRPRRRTRSGVALALLLGGALGAAQAARAASLPGCPRALESEVAALINQERARVGLGALALEVRLVAAARGHSEDMVAGNFFSHTGSNGSSFSQRLAAAGYTPLYAGGETIAAGQTTPAAVVQAWMNSPPHRSILLGSGYLHVGVGYAYGAATSYRHYWTADFGRTSGAGQTAVPLCNPDCSDGLDNDGDGRTDFGADPGCGAPEASRENPTCDDGIDNDGDGLVDRADPHCPASWLESELSACGLGFEIALLLPPLARLRCRRGARRADQARPVCGGSL